MLQGPGLGRPGGARHEAEVAFLWFLNGDARIEIGEGHGRQVRPTPLEHRVVAEEEGAICIPEGAAVGVEEAREAFIHADALRHPRQPGRQGGAEGFREVDAARRLVLPEDAGQGEGPGLALVGQGGIAEPGAFHQTDGGFRPPYDDGPDTKLSQQAQHRQLHGGIAHEPGEAHPRGVLRDHSHHSAPPCLSGLPTAQSPQPIAIQPPLHGTSPRRRSPGSGRCRRHGPWRAETPRLPHPSAGERAGRRRPPAGSPARTGGRRAWR